MTHDEAMEYLLSDGNLRVPCSKYGHDTATCAPVAIAIAVIVTHETGEPMELDDAMSLVVNDHEDVAYLLLNYGREHGYPPEDYLDNADLARAIVSDVTGGYW